MADHIPFVNSETDCSVLKAYYADSQVIRVPLDMRQGASAQLPRHVPLWIDPAIDGLHELMRARKAGKGTWKRSRNEGWQEWLGSFGDVETISDPEFLGKPNKSIVEPFVRGLLDKCKSKKARWISVPQLPHVNDTSRNKINRLMADATARWFAQSTFSGKLILPLILTHQNQLQTKESRTAKIKAAASSFRKAKAHGLWVIDATLDDSTGSMVLRNSWLPNLINLHKELLDALPSADPLIAGPYWAINLVLWARGLASDPAINMGTGYRYYLSGGFPVSPATRVAIDPIRQRAKVGRDLDNWLNSALQSPNLDKPTVTQLVLLRKNMHSLRELPRAQRQVARFYKGWIDSIAKVPPQGRAMALYQDFSSAYVVGRMLRELPRGEGTARHRGRVAETFMLNCL